MENESSSEESPEAELQWEAHVDFNKGDASGMSKKEWAFQ